MDDRLIAQVNATATSLRAAAKAAEDELAAEQRERQAIDARIDQLQALIKQLDGAVTQAEGTVSGNGSTAKKAAVKRTSKKATARKPTAKKSARKRTSARAGAGRQDAVVKVLAAADGPMRPAEVAEKLRADGRDDTSSQVSAALSQLANGGRAVKVEQGLYQAKVG